MAPVDPARFVLKPGTRAKAACIWALSWHTPKMSKGRKGEGNVGLRSQTAELLPSALQAAELIRYWGYLQFGSGRSPGA